MTTKEIGLTEAEYAEYVDGVGAGYYCEKFSELQATLDVMKAHIKAGKFGKNYATVTDPELAATLTTLKALLWESDCYLGLLSW